MSNKRAVVLIIILVVLASGLFKAGEYFREGQDPYKIGLVTTLSGPAATSGARARNGAILAVEQVNRGGGINGRRVELIVKDDGGTVEEAIRADREVMDAGVMAILGHFLSSLAVATVPLMNERNVLMVGLGTITSELSNLDDNFMRVTVPVDTRIPVLAKVAFQKLGLRDMVVVLDLSNPEYTEPCCRFFTNTFSSLGGTLKEDIVFNSKQDFSSVAIAEQIAGSGSDGVLLITQALHSALIAQHLKILDDKIKMIDSGWGISDPELLTYGGDAVEGLVSVHQFNPESSSDRYVRFLEEYQAFFGSAGGNTSQRGYEAASLILYALSETNDPGRLKQAILEKGEFDGIDGNFVINRYGDALRQLYVLEIRNNKITVVETIPPGSL